MGGLTAGVVSINAVAFFLAGSYRAPSALSKHLTFVLCMGERAPLFAMLCVAGYEVHHLLLSTHFAFFGGGGGK